MTLILGTFLLTTAAWAALLCWSLRRVLLHLRNNPAAMQAVTQHVLIPLFGDKPEEK